jgi:CBS domain containing-hemolysin-like protein
MPADILRLPGSDWAVVAGRAAGWEPGVCPLIGLLGLALLGSTLYLSTLSFALRSYSRSRLAGLLTSDAQRPWLEWLDRRFTDLAAVAGFIRQFVVIVLFVSIARWRSAGADAALGGYVLLEAFALTMLALLVFGIAIPHALSTYACEPLLKTNLPVLRVLWTVLWPIARLAAFVDFVVMRLLGKSDERAKDESARASQEILDAVSEGEIQGAVGEDQADMIESVFELRDTDVESIMTPRTDVVAVPSGATAEQVRDVVLREGHSRIPVYEESLDEIVGVVYAKDLLRIEQGEAPTARDLMRSVPFIPESKNVSALLDELRQTKVHIAIVLDEYGGTAGLVTIEDILEELVGEIEDEYEETEPSPMNRIDEDTIEVDARVHVCDVNEALGISLPDDEDYETVGGFVFSTLGRIPSPGEEFEHENLRIHIVDAEERKVNRVRIRVNRESQAA